MSATVLPFRRPSGPSRAEQIAYWSARAQACLRELARLSGRGGQTHALGLADEIARLAESETTREGA